MKFVVTLYFTENHTARIDWEARDLDSLTKEIESKIKHGETYTEKFSISPGANVYNFGVVRKINISPSAFG